MSINVLPTEVLARIITVVLHEDIRSTKQLIPNKRIHAITTTLWPQIARSRIQVIAPHLSDLETICNGLLSTEYHTYSPVYTIQLSACDYLARYRFPILKINRYRRESVSIDIHCYTVYFDVHTDYKHPPVSYYKSIPNLYSRGRYRSIVERNPHTIADLQRDIHQLLSNVLPELSPFITGPSFYSNR